MRAWLSKQRRTRRDAENLYRRIVAQARQPAFYRDFGVADTLEGRFEMVIVHLFVVLERLSQLEASEHGEKAKELAQALMDACFRQLDDDLRALGVGDLAVPKRMRRAAGALLGRLTAYRRALAAADDTALEAALLRNVFGWPSHARQSPGAAAEAHAARARALGGYLRAALAALGTEGLEAIRRAEFAFPPAESRLEPPHGGERAVRGAQDHQEH